MESESWKRRFGRAHAIVGNESVKCKGNVVLLSRIGNLRDLLPNGNTLDVTNHNNELSFQAFIADYMDKLPKECWEMVVELLINYDADEGRYNNATFRISMSPVFTKKVAGFLIDPRLYIHGDFSITVQNNAGDFRRLTAPSDLPDRSRGYHKACRFSMSDISLSESQNIQYFRGKDNVVKIMNGHADYIITDAHAYTSVQLSWKGFGLNLGEEKTNVLEKLFTTKLFSDCVIVAANKVEISCHRSILAAQSDVLLAMLSSGLEESKTNRIEMDDFSECGVKAFVDYLYTNQVDKKKIGEEVAIELLQLGHKYNVPGLETLMLKMFVFKKDDSISMGNVLAIYLLAKNIHGFGYEVLRDKMLGIMKRYPEKLRATEEFKELMASSPNLMGDDDLMSLRR